MIKYITKYFTHAASLQTFLDEAPQGFEIVGFTAEGGTETYDGGVWIIIKYLSE